MRHRWWGLNYIQIFVFMSFIAGRLFLRCPNDGQNVQEEVDDVQVQRDRGEHILFGTDWMLVRSTHHHLRVVNQVETKQQSATRWVNERHHSASDENRNYSEQHQQDKADEQNAAHHGEVPFGLEGEDGQPDAQCCCYSNSKQYLEWKITLEIKFGAKRIFLHLHSRSEHKRRPPSTIRPEWKCPTWWSSVAPFVEVVPHMPLRSERRWTRSDRQSSRPDSEPSIVYFACSCSGRRWTTTWPAVGPEC